ncbi:rhodanese-like domain-containing protein [Larkinella sp. VNQ87]|uniref:rhodanese-like domain-containing protein n=1 Tax=Larkinella sp. VNQ87 TaxID=3400921 RepID=UPI003C092F11
MKRLYFTLALWLSAALLTLAQDKPGLTPAAEFASLLKNEPDPQLIDARSPEEFALNHIDGAINLNLQNPNYEAEVKKLDVSRPVFVYSIQNGRSSALAKDLRSRGFSRVYDLEKGIGSWVGGGYPLYTSAKADRSLADYQQVLATNKLVLVDIGSRYCGACKRVKPILEELRKEHGNALTIVELELEESPALIASLKTVTAFPYLILYKEGQIVWKRSGIADLKPQLDGELTKAK